MDITMKKSLLLITLTLPVLLSLNGCVFAVGGDGDSRHHFAKNHHDKEFENRKKIAQLNTQMTFLEIQNKLGVADFNEVYEKKGQQIQVLFYRTHIVNKDGITAKDECTPLVFINGVLTSWGEQAYNML